MDQPLQIFRGEPGLYFSLNLSGRSWIWQLRRSTLSYRWVNITASWTKSAHVEKVRISKDCNLGLILIWLQEVWAHSWLNVIQANSGCSKTVKGNVLFFIKTDVRGSRYKEKSMRPNTEPWGTPQVRGAFSEEPPGGLRTCLIRTETTSVQLLCLLFLMLTSQLLELLLSADDEELKPSSCS